MFKQTIQTTSQEEDEHCQETLFCFAGFIWFPLAQKQFSPYLGSVGKLH